MCRSALGVLLLLGCVVSAGARDFYKILGVGRDADAPTLKKAYYALSRKYHPDKVHDESEKAVAHEKFLEVSEAYQVLSNPEKRRIYDLGGEDALKGDRPGGGPGFSAGEHHFTFVDPFDLFSRFAGGGGGGFGGFESFFGEFGFPFGEGGGRPPRGPPPPPHGRPPHGRPPYGRHPGRSKEAPKESNKEDTITHKFQRSKNVKILDPDKFKRRVEKRGDPWMVLFYVESSPQCRDLVPEWEKMADTLASMIHTGVVNCEGHAELCRQHDIRGYPSVKLFVNGNPDDYTDRLKARSMIKFATAKGIPDTTARLAGHDAQRFVQRSTLPTVLLFTHKAEVPLLFKWLAQRFQGRMQFGWLGDGEGVEVQQDFGVQTLPAIVFFHRDGSGSEEYDGDLTPSALESFLLQKDPTRSTIHESMREEDDVARLTPRTLRRLCIDSSVPCVLAVLSNRTTDSEHDIVRRIAKRFRNNQFVFVASDGRPSIRSALALTFPSLSLNPAPRILVYRARRRRYALHIGAFDEPSISTFLESILTGDALWETATGVPNLQL